jgi:hypothetical protein
MEQATLVQTTQDMSQQLWAQYTATIASQMGAGASAATIQVLPAAQLLSGDTADDINTTIQKFAEVIPLWGAAYNPSDYPVVDAYQIILTQMQETATNGTSIETEYNTEQKKLSDMMGAASTFKIGKIKDWQSACDVYKQAGIPVPSFTDWFNDNGLQEYNAMVQNQIHQSSVVSTLLQAEGIASPLVEALAALNTALDANKDKLSMPITINPGATVLVGWKSKPTNPTTLSFNDTSTKYDYSQSEWQSESGTELFGFISIGHRSDSGTQTNIFNSTTSYSIQIDFAAQTAANVTQGDWFNGAILREYKSGPWVAGSQFATNMSHPYGDADAVFPLMVTRLYIVFNPTITITQQKDESNSMFSQLNSSFANGVN